MSDTIMNIPLSPKITERRFPFLKKRMKTPKVSRMKIHQNFASKGWNTCSTQFDLLSGGECEYDIKYSPTKYLQPCKRLCIQDSCPKKKPMLTEIHNIKSVFEEKKITSPKKNPPKSFYDFMKNLHENEKFPKNCLHKRLISRSFNLQNMEAAFQMKEQQIDQSFKSDHTIDSISPCSPSKIISNEKKISSKSLNKLKKISETFINNSFNEKCVNENIGSQDLIKNDSSPSLGKPSKSLCTSLPILFIEPENETLLNSSNEKSRNEDVHPSSKQLKSSKDLYTSLFVPSVENGFQTLNIWHQFSSEGKNIIINNSSSEKSIYEDVHSDNLISNDSSPKELKSSSHTDLSTSLLVPSVEEEETSNVGFKVTSEGKSLNFNNKTFMKTLQSSFQEKYLSANKGSSWVQSLHWDSQTKNTNSGKNDQVGKKIFKNLVHGGFAEQMLKLQRREQSDRVIWKHKMNELKKKGVANSVTLTLVSVLHVGYNIVTKCYASETDSEKVDYILCNKNSGASHLNLQPTLCNKVKDLFCDNAFENMGLKPFIVLFKRNIFSKLQLKVKDMFVLYPPWQVLSVPSLPFPVILCSYYVDSLNKSLDIPYESSVVQSKPVIYYSLETKQPVCEELSFSNIAVLNSLDLYGKCVCISARIHRIWQSHILNDRVKGTLRIEDFGGFSLLLQSQDGMFLELKINSNNLSQSYHKFLLDAEGLCFKFCDVIMSHRYNLKNGHELSRVIEFIRCKTKRDTVLSSPQTYCFQFIPSSFNKVPKKILDENFPVYYDYEIKPLSFLQKNCLCDTRFSCIGKILFQNKQEFYMCDESLLSSKLQKYCKLKFERLSKMHKQSLVGVTVLIKEAVIYKDFLFVDKFSSCEILSNTWTDKFISSHKSRLEKIGFITYEHVLSPLSLSSKVKELVFVNGTITQVDENNATSWLECSQCSKDNLLEDSNSVIYCEDCSCTVSKPVLKVKMEVTIQSVNLSSAKVNILLQSSTIKRILKICEDNYQPQCDIADVFEKKTGTLSCYIRDIEIVNKQKVFQLTEMLS